MKMSLHCCWRQPLTETTPAARNHPEQQNSCVCSTPSDIANHIQEKVNHPIAQHLAMPIYGKETHHQGLSWCSWCKFDSKAPCKIHGFAHKNWYHENDAQTTYVAVREDSSDNQDAYWDIQVCAYAPWNSLCASDFFHTRGTPSSYTALAEDVARWELHQQLQHQHLEMSNKHVLAIIPVKTRATAAVMRWTW